MNRDERKFVGQVRNIVYHIARIEYDHTICYTNKMLGEVQGSREKIVVILRRKPGLKGNLDELFEAGCRAGFLKVAKKMTTDARKRDELAAWMEGNSRYSYEQVVAFDPRKRQAGGRWMEAPDPSTFPPGVALAHNERSEDATEEYPVIYDPGRMACDGRGDRYTRILLSDRGPQHTLPVLHEAPPDQPGIYGRTRASPEPGPER